MSTQSNPYLEKSASLLAGAAITHLAQNVATNAAMKSKGVAKYLANSFRQGYDGVVDKSLKARALRAASSVTLPDVSAAHRTAHEAGGAMAGILKGATKRQHAAVRLMTKGKFDLVQKHFADDAIVGKAHAELKKHLPSIPDLKNVNTAAVSKLWKDKSHPLLSNISANISKGVKPVGDHFKPGKMNQVLPTVSSLASGIADPAAGVLNTAKAVSLSEKFQANKYGKKAVDMMKKQFVDSPIQHGLESKKAVKGIGHEAYKFGLNPTSAHLKRTTAALKDAASPSTP